MSKSNYKKKKRDKDLERMRTPWRLLKNIEKTKEMQRTKQIM